jgi:hypothetical protein
MLIGELFYELLAGMSSETRLNFFSEGLQIDRRSHRRREIDAGQVGEMRVGKLRKVQRPAIQKLAAARSIGVIYLWCHETDRGRRRAPHKRLPYTSTNSAFIHHGGPRLHQLHSPEAPRTIGNYRLFRSTRTYSSQVGVESDMSPRPDCLYITPDQIPLRSVFVPYTTSYAT